MRDITKYVSKDTEQANNLNDFFADFEEYSMDFQNKHNEVLDESMRPESGDMVGWFWKGEKYSGIIRTNGPVKDGSFAITQVKRL